MMALNYIPTPTDIKFNCIYAATANKSGRMQYHKIGPGSSKVRISRTEFIQVFNKSKILAMKPLQIKAGTSAFQMEFYI